MSVEFGIHSDRVFHYAFIKGALSRRFCYIFVKMAQIFDKDPFSNIKLL